MTNNPRIERPHAGVVMAGSDGADGAIVLSPGIN
jgi:hypothetical protein